MNSFVALPVASNLGNFLPWIGSAPQIALDRLTLTPLMDGPRHILDAEGIILNHGVYAVILVCYSPVLIGLHGL
jgi:hypothetical protein